MSDWASLKQSILKEAVWWARRNLRSGMPLNDVDVFTILMGKSIEHYTRAFANANPDKEALTLSGNLSEIARSVAYVRASAMAEASGIPLLMSSSHNMLELG